MKNLIVIILFVFLSVSCKTKKEFVKADITTKETVTSEQSVESAYVTDQDVVVKKEETNIKNDNTIIEETITDYSVPDSTGKQYVEEVTTRKISTDKQAKKQAATVIESKVTVAAVEVKKDSVNIQAEAQIKVDTKTVSRAKTLPIVIILIVISAVVFFVVKYWSKIKRLKPF